MLLSAVLFIFFLLFMVTSRTLLLLAVAGSAPSYPRVIHPCIISLITTAADCICNPASCARRESLVDPLAIGRCSR
jgi:hypothetical protein